MMLCVLSFVGTYLAPGLNLPHEVGLAIRDHTRLDFFRLSGAVAPVAHRLGVNPAVAVDAVAVDAAVLHTLAARVGALRNQDTNEVQ